MKALERSNFDNQFQTIKGRSLCSQCGVGPKFKLIQAFMVVLVTCKNDDDQSKNELTIVLITFLPLSDYKSMGNFPDIQGQLTPQIRVRSCGIPTYSKFKADLDTCKNKDDQIKNECSRMPATLYIYFSDAPGQLTQ